jgi:ADP-ribosylglycohydrolase
VDKPEPPTQTFDMSTLSQILVTSLIGDALALGAHWIYSQREIAEKHGRITGYASPLTSYHPGKQAGDFTHYGDQTMVLLRSLATHGRFDLVEFANEWHNFWDDPATLSYRDGATKSTLENLRAGRSPEKTASSSNDIAGAARIAPLFLLKWDSPDVLLAAVRAQTAFTHGNPVVAEAAEFFGRVTLAVHAGMAIPDAVRSFATQRHWNAIPADWIVAAEVSSASTRTDSAAVQAHGLTCHTPEAFPAICHLLLRHPEDASTALEANVEAGGDSAARGMIMGMIYGAKPNAVPIPPEWLSGLRARGEIEQLISELNFHG